MILENAVMTVQPGREDAFVAALGEAREILAQSPGWRDLQVHRGVERPSSFLLLISWDTLEDHTVGFRGGELFVQWRAVLGPFFDGAPVVEHWQPIA